MPQFPGVRPRLRQHSVSEEQQVPRNLRRGVDQKRQKVDLGIPEVMTFIDLSGEALRRHSGVLGAPCGLQDVKEVEADRLLDLNGRSLGALLADIPDPDIAASPKVVHVLFLGGEQFLESLRCYPIECSLGTTAELFGRSRLRGVIDDVFSELDRHTRPGLYGER